MWAAERLDIEEPALQRALSLPEQKADPARRSYAIVNYIGYQRHKGHTYPLTDDVKFSMCGNVAKINVAYLDASVTGQQPFRVSALAVPGVVFRRAADGDLRKADIWLLGVVAVQLLARRVDPLIPDFAAAVVVAARILEQGRTGSGLELLFLEHAEMLPADAPQALDFVRRCLTVNSEERPSLKELWDHLFLAMTEVVTEAGAKATAGVKGDDE
ncbi:hypothetical protein GGTG_13987 [Gaeumannomyces tritici R3-111a-1]|uniref:Protein kinase domain-containing protein n=1 Tax=Gaeumannomyces tritici (strain R3-111a-1) TaxID=644352 RepID=J3PKD3_GAET3|nr:hypothetical protein GGTG_13987 [Gaeumannomyces tritici R3-111a-1]EJT68433.1 hypothetical protein GGTG_13987 [Gaeumannomyces tritici R3-111a-1]